MSYGCARGGNASNRQEIASSDVLQAACLSLKTNCRHRVACTRREILSPLSLLTRRPGPSGRGLQDPRIHSDPLWIADVSLLVADQIVGVVQADVLGCSQSAVCSKSSVPAKLSASRERWRQFPEDHMHLRLDVSSIQLAGPHYLDPGIQCWRALIIGRLGQRYGRKTSGAKLSFDSPRRN